MARSRSPNLSATTATFRSDDPLGREPETQDASGVQSWTIDLFIDLAINLFGDTWFAGDAVCGRATSTRSMKCPTRAGLPTASSSTRCRSTEAARGPHAGVAPAEGPWTIIAAKEIGAAPGFTIQDTNRNVWFVSFDARGYPEAATGAILVANKIFWTLGYWQPDTVLTHIHPHQVVIGDTATVKPMSGTVRQMRSEDLDDVWRRAERSADGSYRAVAARKLPGRAVGGFRYYGTRPDDPNDVVPHEHRRELRALKVFGAWTNLVDMKAGNTLDMVVTEDGKQPRAALPAGRRLDLRHRRQRATRIRRGVGAPVRRRPGVEADGVARLLHAPLADGPLRGPARDRTLRRRGVRSRQLEAARADRGASAMRSRTICSGPRGASWPFPTR